MADQLRTMKCAACEALEDRIAPERAAELIEQVPEWRLEQDRWLVRSFTFPNFRDAFAFATRVGLLAEEHGHHPDLEIGWGRCTVRLTTHAVGGLSINDFVLAAHIDPFA
jgi:4a-hydroxytetrahydrobiopterin dehydratase